MRFTTGVVALSLAAATSTAEVMRAGIESVDHGVDRGGARLRPLALPAIPPRDPADRLPLRRAAARQRLRQPRPHHLGALDHHRQRPDVACREPSPRTTFRPFEIYLVVLVLYWLATFAVSAMVNLASALWLRRSVRARRGAVAPHVQEHRAQLERRAPASAGARHDAVHLRRQLRGRDG